MLVLLQTTSNKKKELCRIATILLKRKLIACAQIYKTKTKYMWLDKMIDEKEFVLVCKTDSKNLKKIYKTIRNKHSYDIPEFITTKISHISKSYKKWLLQTCKNS